MICENCSVEHDGSFASGRFCCRKCSNSFARGKLTADKKQDIADRVRSKLRKYSDHELQTTCPVCSVVFKARRPGAACCSRSCGTKLSFANLTDEQKSHHSMLSSNRMKSRYAAGDDSIGWQTRTKSSYPETFFEKLLAMNDIHFQREVRIGRWFADFVHDKHVLEIDGRQHDERQESDKQKDEFLKEQGFTVTRIRWCNPRSKQLATMMAEFESWKELIGLGG